MRWTGNKEQAAYMKFRQKQNLDRFSLAEEWAFKHLKTTNYKWTRQAIWGCRLFDFWNTTLGIAVEIDGIEHDAEYDQYRDKYNYYRSGILVLRVPNFDEELMQLCLLVIQSGETKKQRKAFIRNTVGLKDGRPMRDVIKIMNIPKAHLNWVPQ